MNIEGNDHKSRLQLVERMDLALHAAVKAGHEIMRIYKSGEFGVELKADRSLLTLADKASHQIILELLTQSGVPVLSEEDQQTEYPLRKDWDCFWLVDPVDGTKEFVNRNGEFTVNIALMQNQTPVAGVIYVPVTQELYVGVQGEGAYKMETDKMDISFAEMKEQGLKLPVAKDRSVYTVVGSRSFMNQETKDFIDTLRKDYPNIEVLSRGSSLKICMLAEGKADIYPRFGPTMEWDTAAGHAIVKAVGKNIYQLDTGTPLEYNKQNLLNPFFVVK
ncbi:3'(2'),5'-bisphosphate nucleotidase CysQ [Sunxiuqinia elliptica]|uniref:3'(2'),5'-bisphosphate nucleotidase CysQ n=1 Tax=Sunxiuqinia elliptica TaxID=655355 RepID=A0A4R6GLB9_9BACT|nr:3'(2'),5'-bisphosphate nucleotidase CysQ [Sunxiuqinia elliptica]TDN95856.1 3'(2'),5'-bisphosphate nucleotidase [Sunxiuqinia elliptica]TDO67797.1 3'(2'),5'-bisphosphate nucleotidase [Sunxiuqinia elliptica]